MTPARKTNMPKAKAFDYIAETELTASNVFSPQNVGVIELTDTLAAVIHAAQAMDKFKKALFRQRTREESGLDTVLRPGEILLSDALGERAAELDDLFHGIIGVITETGELAEVVMDFLTIGKQPDLTNVREEIGDVLWYLARLIKWAKTTFPAEMQRNIAKLRLRHGQGGFDKGRDIERNLAEEHALLEGDSDR